jgi:hypothetical protein
MKGGGYLTALSAMALLFMVSSAPSPAVPDFFFSDFSAAEEYPPKAPVGLALAEAGLVMAASGSASNSSAALPVTLMVERGRIARPSHAQKLLDDLHRIEPSERWGSRGDVESDYRGRMLLSEEAYILRNIDLYGGREASELEASILKATFSGEVVVGSLIIRTERRGRVWDGLGVLTMEDGIFRGDYALVLEISPQDERVEVGPQASEAQPADISKIIAAASPPRRR